MKYTFLDNSDKLTLQVSLWISSSKVKLFYDASVWEK